MLYEKTLSNIQEVKAREGIVIARGVRRGRRGGAQDRGSRDRDSATQRTAAADSRDRAAATAGLSHRRAPRLRRGSAAQSGQERDGGVKQWQFTHQLHIATRGKGLYEFTREIEGWLRGHETRHRTADRLLPAHFGVAGDSGERRSRRGRRPGGFLQTPGSGGHRFYRHTAEGPDDMTVAHPLGADADAIVDSDSQGQAGAGDLAGRLSVRASRAAAPAQRRACICFTRLRSISRLSVQPAGDAIRSEAHATNAQHGRRDIFHRTWWIASYRSVRHRPAGSAWLALRAIRGARTARSSCSPGGPLTSSVIRNTSGF